MTLLLHPASTLDPDALAVDVSATLGLDDLVTGRDDYQRRIAYVDGDDARWAYEAGDDYDLFVVAGWESRRIGRRTADVLRHALARGRACVLFEADLHEIMGVRTCDADDWQSGWLLVLGVQDSRDP